MHGHPARSNLGVMIAALGVARKASHAFLCPNRRGKTCCETEFWGVRCEWGPGGASYGWRVVPPRIPLFIHSSHCSHTLAITL